MGQKVSEHVQRLPVTFCGENGRARELRLQRAAACNIAGDSGRLINRESLPCRSTHMVQSNRSALVTISAAMLWLLSSGVMVAQESTSPRTQSLDSIQK